MRVLDCESIDSTYKSIEVITGLKTTEVIEFLTNYCPRKYSIPGDRSILREFMKLSGKQKIEMDAVCWFHLTRTYKGNLFLEGILPLGDVIEELWEFLFSLMDGFSRDKWDGLKKTIRNKEGHDAFLYNMKTSDSIHWGPYAILIRDAAFRYEEIGNHNYLGIPEIVEDICRCFDQFYQLENRFLRATSPCVVKFISYETKEYYLGIALYYLYKVLHGEALSLNSNTCFDGGNKKIPNSKILDIQFLQD